MQRSVVLIVSRHRLRASVKAVNYIVKRGYIPKYSTPPPSAIVPSGRRGYHLRSHNFEHVVDLPDILHLPDERTHLKPLLVTGDLPGDGYNSLGGDYADLPGFELRIPEELRLNSGHDLLIINLLIIGRF